MTRAEAMNIVAQQIQRALKLTCYVLIATSISGCTTMQDFTACTLIAGLANERSYTFDGHVNGEHVKDRVDWTADYRDPSYMDPISCTQMLARRRELLANPPPVAAGPKVEQDATTPGVNK